MDKLITGYVGSGVSIRFWIDTWAADRPFKVLFPDLFALETCKSIFISQCLISQGPYLEWKWRWKRSLNTTEEQQLVTCKNFLNQVQITNTPDKWKWSNNSSGAFTVASMRSLLHRPIDTNGFRLQWNNWIQVKVNIFGWRAEMDRIATKDALLMRGIITNSSICALCGEYNETAAHLLVACYFANMTWHFISSWCKIQPIFAFNIKDILEVHKSIDGSRNKRKVVLSYYFNSMLVCEKLETRRSLKTKNLTWEGYFKRLSR
ncbi:hypothetical protein QVD17_15206 [Tagetes erecta]|uniref:Reverse transcriptase zinc-binding domain-containing protein n=1 Tax=Tagetes erecta TaxID=13708 RepID=A0AAD8KP93_TARER|nr:hypothetical protein QVD17_15206 [Tagetes erecta]